MTGHIRRRGARSWELKFDLGTDPATGKRITRYHSFKGTKREAEAELIRLKAAADRGEYVEPSKLTVAEYVRARVGQWEASGSIGSATAERYHDLVANQIVPHLGAKLLQKVRPFDIEAWHATLKTVGRKDGKGGISARTIGHAHRILKRAFGEALKNDLITKNAAAAQRAPKVEAEEVVILTADQVKALLPVLAGRAIYALAVVALLTGLRRGELLALRWSNVDLAAKVLQVREALQETKAGIRFKAPKTRSGIRNVTLPDLVVDVLREHRRRQLEQRLALGLGKLPDRALVFSRPEGEPLSPLGLSQSWRQVARSIGLPNIAFHALRHTHASQLIDGGIDIVTISKRLGHASPNITLQVYAHLFRKSDDRAAQAINAALASFGDP
jgi:integrase